MCSSRTARRPTQRASIGWARRQGLSDSNNQFHYFRLTADDRILWGGYDAIHYFGSRVDPELDRRPATFDQLEAQFFRAFPQLEGLWFPYRWGGAIDTTTRFTVTFGQTMGGRVTYALGYTGLGVGASRWAGGVVRDFILRPDEDRLRLRIVDSPPIPFPPEPLRSMAVNVVRHELDRADRDAAGDRSCSGRSTPWGSASTRLNVPRLGAVTAAAPAAVDLGPSVDGHRADHLRVAVESLRPDRPPGATVARRSSSRDVPPGACAVWHAGAIGADFVLSWARSSLSIHPRRSGRATARPRRRLRGPGPDWQSAVGTVRRRPSDRGGEPVRELALSVASGSDPWPSTASWNARGRTTTRPVRQLGPQPLDLALSDLVGQRLAGPADVAVGLDDRVRLRQAGRWRKSIERWRGQRSACRPVSTTSRAARQACASSIPNRSASSRKRPISSASRSLYRPQPST